MVTGSPAIKPMMRTTRRKIFAQAGEQGLLY
jgi:hypothetical protein